VAGESKWDILGALSDAQEVLPATIRIPGNATPPERVRLALAFLTDRRLGWPLVLKPDIGERGDGVAIVRSEAQLVHYLDHARGDVLAQEYVPGREFGVFYYRIPGEARGRIFSITDKRFPHVTGDGISTLETLILKDDRTVCVARLLLARYASRLWEIPAPGEVVRLVELGTHCRGAVFLDGGALATPTLEAAVDRLSRGFAGFYFGRYDVRTESEQALQEGRFRVIELNGVTSEATSIYQPGRSLPEAYRTLFRQWRIAFQIGAVNREAGVRPSTLRELSGVLRRHRRAKRDHVTHPTFSGTVGALTPEGPAQ